MRVLVTGGAGFIGSHVVDRLVQGGHSVQVLDRLHPCAHAEPPEYLNRAADYHWGDVADLALLRALTADLDAVCHHAAMVGLGAAFSDVDAYASDNDLGTARLLRALHERRFSGRLVLASSMVVYGEGRYRCAQHGPTRPHPRTADDIARAQYDPRCPRCRRVLTPEPVPEDTPPDPRSVYAATKLHQEHLCAAYGNEHDAAVTMLRYHNAYGPRMPADTPYAGVAAIFRSALQNHEAPRVFEDGRQLRDFVHVHDVTTATVAALESRQPVHGPVNVGSGTPRSVLELAQRLHRSSSTPAPPPVVVGGARPGDVRHIFGDTTLARAALGFEPRVPFREGIAELAHAPLRATSPVPELQAIE